MFVLMWVGVVWEFCVCAREGVFMCMSFLLKFVVCGQVIDFLVPSQSNLDPFADHLVYLYPAFSSLPLCFLHSSPSSPKTAPPARPTCWATTCPQWCERKKKKMCNCDLECGVANFVRLEQCVVQAVLLCFVLF